MIGFESLSDFLLKIGRLFLTVQTDVVPISIALGVVLLVDAGGARRGDVPPPRSLNAGPHGACFTLSRIGIGPTGLVML